MLFGSKSLVSKTSTTDTRLKILEGYDQAIKNEFFISESFVEQKENQDKLLIFVKAFRFLRKGGPTKYSVEIKSNGSGSLIKISSIVIIFRLVWVILCIGFLYAFMSKPLFFNYVIDFVLFVLAFSFIITENYLERKKILKAIGKTLII